MRHRRYELGRVYGGIRAETPEQLAAIREHEERIRRQPNIMQMAALQAYAAEKGRSWKSRLRADWSRADPRIGGQTSGELQQLRNELGPSWLVRFKLPKYSRVRRSR